MSAEVEGPVYEPYREKAVRLTGNHAFRPGWAWSGAINEWFQREVHNLVDPAPGPVIHICSGSSRLGDLRVDAFHDTANLKADMLKLPFKDAAAGTVICDPPYELSLQDRFKLGFEVARIARSGGRLLWKAPWMPLEGMWHIERVEVASLRVGMPRDAHLLVRAKRREVPT